MKIAQNITELIGNTPMVKLNKLTEGCYAQVVAKLEFFNPASSVKDRIGLAMIEDAEKTGRLNRGSVIIEPTSGNTGIALAYISAVKGYRLILTMPESMSMERRNILKGFGAELVLTPAALGMKGAVQKAEDLNKEIPNSIILQQFNNPANPQIHRITTAEEIWNDTEGNVDIFVAGVGSGGTIMGVSQALKSKKASFKAIAVEPVLSPVLSGGNPGAHKIQGIGAGFIPGNINMNFIDEIIHVSNEQAIETARKLIRFEGIFCGISSGANIFAALEMAKRKENEGKLIVTIACDTAERYLSTLLYENF